MLQVVLQMASAASSDGGSDSSTLITVLVAIVAVLGALLAAVVVPRLTGTLIPRSRLEDSRRDYETKLAAATAEATTWQRAHGSMKEAYDALLEIQRAQQQSLYITNALMGALRGQITTPPPSGTTTGSAPVGGI